MKIKHYLAFALIASALGSCKKSGGENPDTVDPEGKMAKANLTISIPKSIRTYAPGDTDPLATNDEIVANTIDVFIYDDGGSYALTYYRFDPADDLQDIPAAGEFAYNAGGTQFITADFDVREGPKLVYVGINLPSFIVDRLKTGYYVNEIYEQTDLVDLLADEIESGGSAEVAFFNTAIVKQDINADDLPTIAVSVSRLVAKVVVRADGATAAAWDVSGGTVSDFAFAIGQRNNQLFVSPLVNGEDPNYSAATIPNVSAVSSINTGIQKLQFVRTSDYISANDLTADAGDGTSTNMRYTTENTSAGYRHQDVTYVSIRAKFIPHRLGADADTGTLPDDGTGYNTSEIAGGFYAVFTGEPTGEDALGVRYFGTLEDARDFVTGAYFTGMAGAITESSGPGYDEDALAGESDHYIFFYENSYCYYRIYLNPNLRSDGEAGTGTGNYNILRNTVYLATITGVNYIGTTRPNSLPGSYENHLTNTGRGTPTWPGAWFPNALPNTPVLPTQQISPLDLFTGLNVGITLEDWVEDNQDYEVY